MLPINSGTSRTKDVTGLIKYTEYEFQSLAFTSVGDGPNSSVALTKTKKMVRIWIVLRNRRYCISKI